jgi:hypothetical protein
VVPPVGTVYEIGGVDPTAEAAVEDSAPFCEDELLDEDDEVCAGAVVHEMLLEAPRLELGSVTGLVVMIVGLDSGMLMLVPPADVGVEKPYGDPGAVVEIVADSAHGVVVETVVEAFGVVAGVLVVTGPAVEDVGVGGGNGELLGLLSVVEMVIETVVRLVVVL